MQAYEPINSSKTLLLGASGFIGRHLRRLLPDAFAPNWRLESDELARWIVENEPHLVLNAAGRTRGTVDELFSANVVAVDRLFQSLKPIRSSVRYIGMGSAAEYGSVRPEPVNESTPCGPISDYGRAKWEATQRAQAFWGDQAVILRPANVIGPGMSSSLFLGNVLQQLHAGATTIEVHRLDAIRDLIAVQDVARAACELAIRPQQSGIFNSSTGQGVSNSDVLQTVQEVLNRPFDVRISAVSHQSSGLDVFIASNRKLRNATGWTPALDLKSVIQETWEALA